MPRPARTSSLVNALSAPGTAIRRRPLVAAHGRAALRRAKDRGLVQHLLPHIYAHHDNLADFTTRVRAAMTWLPASVAVTGVAACAIYDLVEVAPELIRASAPSPLHVRQPSWLRLRRCIVDAPTSRSRGVRVTRVPDAIIHAWEESRALATDAIFCALREGLTTVAEIRLALDHYPRVKGRRRLTAFLLHLHDGMHSWLEYRAARTVLNTPDLECLKYQESFIIEGNAFAVDRYDPVTRTAVELDGFRFHGSEEAQARDRWRDGLLESAGIHPVHLTYEEVVKHPARCRARVRAVIAERRAVAEPP